MQILIIEDEPRAASQLQRQLQACKLAYNLLGIIDTVEDAVKWLKEHASPELIFMDIQLADGLSFEIFQNVTVDAPIIFTTAFDQYAIQAFKVNSIDYLLKPIQQSDLETALKKFTRTVNPPTVAPYILQELLSSMQEPKHRSGILVKAGNGFIQVKIQALYYIYSEDSITFGVTQNNRVIIEETIDELYKTLNKDDFFRINRGQIVAKEAIQKIEAYFNHRLKLTMLNERKQEFIVSRPKTNEFKVWMNT